MTPRLSLTIAATLAVLAMPAWAAPAERTREELSRELSEVVRPFLAAHCVSCHGADKPKGQLDLTAFTDLSSVVGGFRRWTAVLEMLASGEMPPEKARPQPSAEARARVVAWIQAVRRQEAGRSPGDPGPVLARRLSNAEYDYTIRDLTGVDLRPTREFPVDPANEAGFDNSGESLLMSTPLFKKYLDAARGVADHLVLAPDGLRFAPHPAVTDTDRDRYAVDRILRFYQRQPTDLARYFHAAWQFRHRAALGRPGDTLAAIAGREGLSARYLNRVWSALNRPEEVGPLATLQGLFRGLPAPPVQDGVRARCETMRDFVARVRPKVAPDFPNLRLKAVGAGSQPFVLWKNTQRATHRWSFYPGALHLDTAETRDPGVGPDAVRATASLVMSVVQVSFRNLVHDSTLPLPFATHELAQTFTPADPALAVPEPGQRARYEAAFARFCRVFPDAFYVAERGRTHLDKPRERQEREEKGRSLSAGYHNMFGYFRDDQPLYQEILDPAGRRELDGLWRELDFITRAPVRQHADFIFYERAESRTIKGPAFDFVRSEDRAATSPAMIRRLADAYLALARASLRSDGGDPHAVPVLEAFFRNVAGNVQRFEQAWRAAEPVHLNALLALARRAYRRPLAADERTALLTFYRAQRGEGLDHEGAIRATLVRVLMSPHFLYRVPAAPAGAAAGVRPLDDHALASRLSYFLWSSLPDDQLLAHAARGTLRQPAVLAAQVRRMLRDPRARALAVEFGGQWLDFRRFEEHNAVDRQRFPAFDDHLRQAMFEEPVRFFQDLISEDRSVLDLIHGRHTFVNAALARHYGMPAPAAPGWVRVDEADRHGRGGLLPMAVFLTHNSPGLRTSPVKRGYWVVRRLLGELIPPPPAQVPELPTDERKLGNLTLRQLLAHHREHASCAGCHARFDSYGLAFEGYGPVGERRTVDLGGRPVDTRATFGAGAQAVERQGVEGLREHLRAHRQDDFLDNLCHKLLAYALGRGLIPSDDATLQKLRARLAAGGYRFGALVETIVASPQFLTRRVDQLAVRD